MGKNQAVYRENGSHQNYYHYYHCNDYKLEPSVLCCNRTGQEFQNDTDETDMEFSNDVLPFRFCASYFKKETIAMWHIYAPLGYCCRYSKSVIEKPENAIASARLTCVNDTEMPVPLDALEFVRREVIYVGHQRKTNVLIRSTARENEKDLNSISKLKKLAPMKSSAWAYETEMRLYVLLKKSFLESNGIREDECKRISLKIKDSIAKYIIVKRSPLKIRKDYNGSNLINESIKDVQVSELGDTVNIYIEEEADANRDRIKELRAKV